MHSLTKISRLMIVWRDGRVVDYNGLENRRTERYRGFESLSLRKRNLTIKLGSFFIAKKSL